MNCSVNLISPQARVRGMQRTRLRQWSRVLAAVGAALIPLTIYTWWPAHRELQHLERLEARYEPIRQLIADNKAARKQIDEILQRDQIALALSEATPVVQLLGLVGTAVSEADGAVYIQQLSFEQSARPWQTASDEPTAVTLRGLGRGQAAAGDLTVALRSVLPLASVERLSSEAVLVNDHPRQAFTLKGSF
jgi:hypothetical protein